MCDYSETTNCLEFVDNHKKYRIEIKDSGGNFTPYDDVYLAAKIEFPSTTKPRKM